MATIRVCTDLTFLEKINPNILWCVCVCVYISNNGIECKKDTHCEMNLVLHCSYSRYTMRAIYDKIKSKKEETK